MWENGRILTTPKFEFCHRLHTRILSCQHQVRLAVVLNCPSVCPSIHLSVCLFHTFSTTKPLNTKTNELIGMHINRGGSQAKGMEQSTLQIKRQGHEALKQATKIRFGEISQKLSDEL